MTRRARPAIRRVGILGHPDRPGVHRAAATLATLLKRRGIEVRFDRRLAVQMERAGHPLPQIARWCQVLVSLGGDGTALAGARALARQRGALLPVNLGGLGFLTIAEGGGLEHAVRAVLAGEWTTVARRLVGAAVMRGGRVTHRGLAMNDAVIKTAGGYSALHLRINALGSDLGRLVADGIIAATAAGSTAYSLSAGGPVLAHGLEALVVTPVCPHTLASRSLLFGPDDALEILMLGAHDRVLLLMDGQDSVELQAGDRVKIALARASVRVFENPEQPFARALQAKLGWQGSERRSLR